MSSDQEWLKKRLDHVNESEVLFFIEKVGVLMNDGIDEKHARPEALIMLCEKMGR